MEDIETKAEQLRERILTRFIQLARNKYDDGQQRHGGCLSYKSNLLYEAEMEAIDLVFYLGATREYYDALQYSYECEIERLHGRIAELKRDV